MFVKSWCSSIELLDTTCGCLSLYCCLLMGPGLFWPKYVRQMCIISSGLLPNSRQQSSSNMLPFLLRNATCVEQIGGFLVLRNCLTEIDSTILTNVSSLAQLTLDDRIRMSVSSWWYTNVFWRQLFVHVHHHYICFGLEDYPSCGCFWTFNWIILQLSSSFSSAILISPKKTTLYSGCSSCKSGLVSISL